MTTVADAATAAKILAVGLTKVAKSHPGATVTRSKVGNLSIVDAEGRYIGWADILTGAVAVTASETAA